MSDHIQTADPPVSAPRILAEVGVRFSSDGKAAIHTGYEVTADIVVVAARLLLQLSEQLRVQENQRKIVVARPVRPLVLPRG
jgi:hypothetical protein